MSAIDRVLERLNGAKRSGDGWEAKCPAHDDRHASLSVAVGADGRVLLCCHAGDGCPLERIVAALGLTTGDLFEGERNNSSRRIVATYDYTDEASVLLFQVVRFDPKAFMQRRPDGSGGWIWKTAKTRRVLYRLQQLIEAVKAGETVYICEGEKDADALAGAGVAATTCPMGAGKWNNQYATPLEGANVIIVRDRDDEGRKHAALVAASLEGVAASVSIVEPVEGKDASDHLAAGKTIDEFAPVPPAGKPDIPASVSEPASAIENASAEPSRPLDELLDDIHAFVTRYIVVGVHEAVAVALWIAHAYVLAAFDSTGYLEVRSPVRRCGKTTLLSVLALLVPRPWTTVEPSEAVFYRRIAADQPTVLLDEVDAIFAKKSEATEGLRACLNAGNQRGMTVPRCQPPRMEIVEFPVFCAKALAGIGGLPATITDRSIPIEMRRKQTADRVERFRSRKARELAAPLAAELARWADGATASVELELAKVEGLADESGPLASLDDRSWEQAWEPLAAVASVAGSRWLDRAVDAAVALSGSRDDELDIGVNLLADIRTVFEAEPDRETLATVELLDALLLLEESPWRDWWSDPRADEVKPSKAAPRKLARTLKPFGVQPADVWMPSGVSRKGYRLDDLRDPWARYLVDSDGSQDGRDPRGPRDASSDAGWGLADTDRESARDTADPRDPRGDTAQPSPSRAPRGSRPPAEREGEPTEWLARDRVWRSFETEPPAFPGEIIDTRHGIETPAERSTR